MLAMALKIKDNRNFVGFGMLRKTDIKHSVSVLLFFFFVFQLPVPSKCGTRAA